MGKSLFIDVREKEIAVYILNKKGERYELLESKKYPVNENDLLSFNKLPGDFESAYLSLPFSHLNFRVIDLPFSDKDKVREVLPLELDGMILGGIDRVVFDEVVIGSSNGKYQILAIYVEKRLIQGILSQLQSYNIDPICITSLELRNILKNFSLERLLNPDAINEQVRTELVAEEIVKPSINLRKDEFSYTRDSEKTKKSLKISGVLFLLIALILLADLLFRIIVTKNEVAFLKDDVRKTYRELFPEEKNIVNELHQFKAHLRELKNREDIFLGIDPLNLLLRLSQIERQDVVFNEITMNKQVLVLKGEATSLSEIQQLQVRLEKVFAEVSISDSKASVGGNMLFTITAKQKI